jgi:pyruvate/2-oxoglutarate dehydrogenase complex dihydrolipoamide acyltransferase (E2) component
MHGRVELRLPDFDLPGVPVTISSWHALTGQRVTEGDRLLEVVAGDVAVDIAAPATGVLLAREAETDERVAAGQLVAVIEPTP